MEALTSLGFRRHVGLLEKIIGRCQRKSRLRLIPFPDGSFTMYLQATSLGLDREANWLSSPKGPFYLILRNYAPVPELATALKDPAT